MIQMTREEAIEKYGPIEDGAWANEAECCEIVSVPTGLEGWQKSDGQVRHIYCNKDMSAALTAALRNVVVRGLADQLKTFDGCLMIRSVRGHPEQMSTHSYALAIDINAATNALGTEGDMSDELAACFTDEGFSWGKLFHRADPMHLSFAWE